MNTLSLLDWDYSFTQQSLIPEEQFAKACVERGIDMKPAHLESLHRQGIVVPIFSIRYVATDLLRRARNDGETLDPAEIESTLQAVNKERDGLLGERRVGDLSDPALDAYHRWSINGSFRTRPYRRRRFLYSPYQLLGLRPMLRLCPDGDPRTLEGRPRLPAYRRTAKALIQQSGTVQRQLAVLLSLLEAAYLPDVRPTLRGFGLDIAEWSRYRSEFDTERAVHAAGYQAADLRSLAENLLSGAHSFDPLADWSDLVALAHHSKRDKLNGLAKLALDHRVAAEMLLLAHEDLARGGAVEALQESQSRWWSPLDYRLGVPRSRLNRTLTLFGLSPHPSVLLVVEGKIDYLAIVGVLDERLRPGWTNAIVIIDAEGVDRDISSVATLVAPLTGDTEGDVVILDRPPTRIVLMVDPEGRMATKEGRDAARQRWIDRLYKALPEDIRLPAARSDLEGLVTVETWDEAGNSFEFAHFSDAQIATAILAASTSPTTPSRRQLIRSVAIARRERRNLRSLWSRWDPPRPSKLQVFRQLESEFRMAVDRSIEDGHDPPTYPAARLIVAVLRAAGRSRNIQTVLRIKEPSDPASGFRSTKEPGLVDASSGPSTHG